MPVFIAEMVARGFWWAILASVIVSAVFTVVGLILGKISKVLGAIARYLPSALFLFYIWNIRQGAGWLVFAIIGAVGFVINFIMVIIAK